MICSIRGCYPTSWRTDVCHRRSCLALSRESQENNQLVPRDYGIYNKGTKVHFVYKSKHGELQTIADGLKLSLHYIFFTQLSYAQWGRCFDRSYSVALTKKVCLFIIHPILSHMKQASLPSSIAERALARDKRCIFTGVLPTSNSDTVVAA